MGLPARVGFTDVTFRDILTIIMSELISEELFDQFRGSDWRRQFSSVAQSAKAEGFSVDELESFPVFPVYEIGLIVTPNEEKQMLKEMGIIEDCLYQKGFITPGMVKDGLTGDPNRYVPRYTEFGKKVIMACENLFTPEEHIAANEAARLELDRRLAEARAELGIQE